MIESVVHDMICRNSLQWTISVVSVIVQGTVTNESIWTRFILRGLVIEQAIQ